MTAEMLRSDDPCAIARMLIPAAPSEPKAKFQKLRTSAGMSVRLSFAIATVMDPEVIAALVASRSRRPCCGSQDDLEAARGPRGPFGRRARARGPRSGLRRAARTSPRAWPAPRHAPSRGSRTRSSYLTSRYRPVFAPSPNSPLGTFAPIEAPNPSPAWVTASMLPGASV